MEDYAFGPAMLATTGGAKVRRREWANPSDHVFIRAGILHIHTDGKDHRFIISDGDILGTDWVVIGSVNQ